MIGEINGVEDVGGGGSIGASLFYFISVCRVTHGGGSVWWGMTMWKGGRRRFTGSR